MEISKICKINGIVVANEYQTLGIGAGQMSRIDSLKIATTLEVIQNSIDRGELKNLMFKVEKLKSDIHKSGSWDSFTKTNEFKKLNKMSHTIRTNINQQRRK